MGFIILIGSVTIACCILYLMIILIRNLVLTKFRKKLVEIIKYSDDETYMNKLLQKYRKEK